MTKEKTATGSVIKLLSGAALFCFLWYVAVETRFTALASEDDALRTEITTIEKTLDRESGWIKRDLDDLKATSRRIEDKLDGAQ